MQLLRGSNSAGGDEELALAFVGLARRARSAGFRIGDADSAYVGIDERTVLGWLALLQRQRCEPEFRENQPLDLALLEALRVCACLLNDSGCRLDYRNAQRVRDSGVTELAASMPAALPASVFAAGAGMLQARVVRFTAAKGVATTHELNAFGASRQVVSTMCKKQLLRRVSHGLYAVGAVVRMKTGESAAQRNLAQRGASPASLR